MKEADSTHQKSDVSGPIAPSSVIALYFANSVRGRFPDEGTFDER